MARLESPELYSVRASRKVEPSVSLEKFVTQARRIGDEVFGYKGAVRHSRTISWQDELLANPETGEQYENLGVSAVLLYSLKKMRLNLFERHVEASDEMNKLLRRLHERLSAPQLRGQHVQQRPSGKKVWLHKDNPLPGQLRQIEREYGVDSSNFSVSAHQVRPSTRDDFMDLGVEYSLVLDTSPESKVIEAQSALIDQTARKTVVGKRLSLLATPSAAALELAFLRAPGADPATHLQFMDELNANCSVVNLPVGPIRWNLST